MKRKNKTILREIEEKAKKNERHFRNNDGTKKCVITNTSMNFYDEKEKKWKPIDNSLVEKEDCFEGKMGKFNSKISKKDRQFVVYSDDASVSWKFIGENGKKLSSVKANSKKNMRDDISVASEVTYENVVDGVDIQYIMSGNNVKENIIVKERLDEYKFNFEFELNGFEMKLSEDNSSIELYSKKTGKLEFTIPSPFMYDANGKESTDVYYEIESKSEEKHILSVVASHEWINNPEREFPIIIDPQLTTTSSDKIISYNIKQTLYEITSSEVISTQSDEMVSDYLRVVKNTECMRESEIIIDRSMLDVDHEKIVSATLTLKSLAAVPVGKVAAYVYVDGSYHTNVTLSGSEFSISLKSSIESAVNEIRILLRYHVNVELGEEVMFYAFGEDSPRISITYMENINRIPTKKSVHLVGGVEAHADILTGDTIMTFIDVEDDVMGLKISHVLKNNDEDFCCGDDVRLNLHEKLIKEDPTSISANYVYTDAIGETHLFNEHFYYLDSNGSKHNIEKNQISIKPNGDMYFTVGEETKKVYREEYTHDGLKATTKIENVAGINFVEQRIDEVKQIEEQVEAYKNAIVSLVVVDDNGDICDTMNAGELNQKLDTFMVADGYMMSKNEAISLKSAIIQRDMFGKASEYGKNRQIIESQLSALSEQRISISRQIDMFKEMSLDFSRRAEMKNAYENYEYSMYYYPQLIYDFVVIDEEGVIDPNASLEIDDFADGKYALTRSEALQYRSLYLQKESLALTRNKGIETYGTDYGSNQDEQVTNIASQLNYFKSLDSQRRSEYKKINEENGNFPSMCTNQIVNYVVVNEIGEIIDEIIISYDSPNVTSYDVNAIVEQYGTADNPRYLLTKSEANQLRSLCLQYDSLGDSIASLELQLSTGIAQNDNAIHQIEALLYRNEEYRKQIKNYAKNYFYYLEELEKLKRSVPVNYIVSDSEIKGFNEQGNLVVIYKNNGTYIAIEYECYDLDEKTRISRVYDENEREIRLLYDDKQLLSEIVDATGKRTKYNYEISDSDGERVATLTSVEMSTSQIVTFEKTETMDTVMSNGLVGQVLRDSDNRVESIIVSTTIKSVSHGNTESFSEAQEVRKILFVYDLFQTTLIDETDAKYIYVFDPDSENFVEYYEEFDGKVSKAEKYDYIAFGHMNVESANDDVLNKSSYDLFVFPMETGNVDEISNKNAFVNNHKIILLDEHNRIVREVAIQANEPKKIEESIYSYDTSKRVFKVLTNITDEKGTWSVVQEMEYNHLGKLLRKQSYIVGQETEQGIEVEEYVYDKKGFEIKSFRYNTKDTSSKVYDEKEINEIGQIVAEFDSLGKQKIKYEYVEGTNVVSSETAPNGSKLAYGFSPRDGESSISMSTADGEENSIQKLYTNGLLTQVRSGDDVYEYTYDYKGRETSVSINGKVHISYAYQDKIKENGKTANRVVATYANGAVVTVTRDIFGNVLSTNSTQSNKTLNITNEYDEKNRLIEKLDTAVNDCVKNKFIYDASGNVKSYNREAIGGSAENYSETFTYDEYGRITLKVSSVTGTIHYFYKDKFATIPEATKTGNIKSYFKQDMLGRNTGKEMVICDDATGTEQKLLSEQITYLKHGDHATNIPVKISYGKRLKNGFAIRDNIKYKYDENCNIHEVYENGEFVAEYKYDSIGRLVRENNKRFGKTYVFTYDNCGNILTKTEYGFTLKPDDFVKESEGATTTYSYSDGKLMARSEIDSEFVYDTIGNPTTYKGWSLTWGFGRRLLTFGTNTFDYDAEGKRIAKNDITFTYDADGKLIKQSNGVQFIYDGSTMIGLEYNGVTYFYQKDLLGNVIAILDSEGNIVVKYNYDAWGNHTVVGPDGYTQIVEATSIGIINPIRYRGYYYDRETGLYYLHSRYYDPVIGRFINIDDISYLDPETINGLNLYAYCGNNPVMYFDNFGNSPGSIWKTLLGVFVGVGLAVVTIAAVVASGGTLLAPVLIGVGIGAGLNLAGQGIANLKSGNGFFENINWGNVVLGGLSGAAFATGIGGLWGVVAIGATSNAGMSALEGKDWINIGFSAIIGGIAASVGYGAGKLVSRYILKNTGFTFKDYYELAIIDANKITAAITSCVAVGYTFLPTITTGVTRGVSKFVGNWIGDLF